MNASFATYIPGNSLLHRADARVKLLLMIAVSVTLFLVETWAGLACLAIAIFALALHAKLSFRSMALMLIPVSVLLFVMWACNAFVLDVNSSVQRYGLGVVSAGFAKGIAPIALVGTFGFSPEGCMHGLFYAVRIIFLLMASFVVVYTTTSNELSDALVAFLRPLRALKVPVDDIATTLSLALRFIPLVAEELLNVKRAQASRGARYDEGSLLQRVRAWSNVFIPLFVGMFRKANTLALAMDSRCYGAHERTALYERRVGKAGFTALVVGLALCVLCAVYL